VNGAVTRVTSITSCRQRPGAVEMLLPRQTS